MNSKQNNRTSRVSFWLTLIISMTALMLAFWGVQPERVLDHLAKVEISFVLVALLLILLGLAARARSWQILLGDRIGFIRVFGALNAGYLLNTVLFFRLGEVARAFLVADGKKNRFGWSISTVFWERVIDAVVCFIGFILVLPAFLHIAWVRSFVIVVSIIILVVILIIALLSLRQAAVLAWLKDLFRKRFSGLLRMLEDFLLGINLFRDYRRIFHAGCWSLIAWITSWLGILVLLRMFNLQGDWQVALFVSGIVAFSAALPSLPGAIGVYELSAVAGFVIFGYAQEVSVSMALVNHFLQLGLTALLGTVALANSGDSIRSITQKLQDFTGRKEKHNST